MLADAVRHHEAGRWNEAERLYRHVLQGNPNHPHALHLLGVLAHQLGRNDIAADLIVRAIAQNHRIAAFHNHLGLVQAAQGNTAEAVASYQRALALQQDYPEAHRNLGNALVGQGLAAKAVAAFDRALVQCPDQAETHYDRGVALKSLGRSAAAGAAYRRSLAVRPDYAEAYCNLGLVLHEDGNLDTAIAVYRRAVVCRPDVAEIYYNFGNSLQDRGRVDPAVVAYRWGLTIKPDMAVAHCNLGNALKHQGKLIEAVHAYRRAVALRPDFAEVHVNLGTIHYWQCRPGEAQTAYRRAVTAVPDDAMGRLGLAVSTLPVVAVTMAESQTAGEAFARALAGLDAWSADNAAKMGRAVGSTQPFYLAYRPDDVTATLSRYGDLACRATAAYWRPTDGLTATSRTPRTRIRIGVVNGHIRRHPVWDVIVRGIIAHLDRQRFEIFIYHTGGLVDEETAWARARADHFVQGPLSMPMWLEVIRRDQPDVLFYPEIGMEPFACILATLRLAPVQVAAWGHPITTGLPTIDLFLSGALLEGADARTHYRETLVPLPGTGVCTASPPHTASTVSPGNRQRQTINFALCQTAYKFDPAYDALYARIAKAAGPCAFWLFKPDTQAEATDRLLTRLSLSFRREGLDPADYLRTSPWLPYDQFLAFLDEMDVYLDCPAFSGYTTAWQAVHRGLPIVTLEGPFLRQRLAAGLLRQIECVDGIAPNETQYLDIAVRWAQDCRRPDGAMARRDALRDAASKADENTGSIRALEEALTKACS